MLIGNVDKGLSGNIDITRKYRQGMRVYTNDPTEGQAVGASAFGGDRYRSLASRSLSLFSIFSLVQRSQFISAASLAGETPAGV